MSAAESEPTAVLPETATQLVELERIQRALAEAEERAKNHWDQYLRAVAEFDNVRKRMQRDVDAGARSAVEKLVLELLPVKDSLALAVENAHKADAASLAAGQQATLKLLDKAFEKVEVRELDPQGEPFDPTRHEAVMAQESRSAEPNSVLKVLQKGYELNGRVLRAARVIVSKT
jgi:molecular chaperone GrpE